MKSLLFMIVLLLLLVNNLFTQDESVNKLIKELNSSESNFEKVDILNHLGSIRTYDSIELAINYLDKAYSLAKVLSYKKGLADNYYFKGIYYYQMNDYENTINQLSQSYDLYKSLNDSSHFINIWKILGYTYDYKGDYDRSIEYYLKLYNYNVSKKKSKKALEISTILGNVYLRKSDYKKAYIIYSEALSLSSQLNDLQAKANCLVNIGIINNYINNFAESKVFMFRALDINMKLADNDNIANNLLNLSKTYTFESNYDSAIFYLNESMGYVTKTNNLLLKGSIISDLAYIYEMKDDYSNSIKLYKQAIQINNEIKNTVAIGYNKAHLARVLLKINPKNKDIEFLLHISDSISSSVSDLKLQEIVTYCYSEYYEKNGDFRNALKYSRLYTDIRDTLINGDIQKEVGRVEGRFEMQNQILEQKRRQDEQRKQKESIIAFSSIGGFIFIIFLIILWKERGKSEKLLLNILPKKIAQRLKKKNKYIADYFEGVSVVFIDISHFTELAKDAKPERIVELLNRIYTEFDKIAEEYHLEKIKTIGDCYMAVAGIPEPRQDHCIAATLFAIESMKKLDGFKTENNIEIFFKAGIDCGEVVAGVIGEKKFIYDLWGDVVNTASRMEEYGEPSKIQVTSRFQMQIESNCHKIKDLALNYGIDCETLGIHFSERGEVDIKGKGLMKTYWLEYNKES